MDGGLGFRKWDLLAIGLVVALAVLVAVCFLPGDAPAATVQVYQDGVLVRTLPLDVDTEFPVEGAYRNTVTIRDGKVAVTASDCPGADCVGCGWTGSAGRSIVCLPNGVEIRVVAADSDVDLVVR